MNVGGKGRDHLLMVIPLIGLVFVVTVWFGGPMQAMNSAERMLYDAWDAIFISVRR
jgi:hypothetical protein